jgi:hypothetical protein
MGVLFSGDLKRKVFSSGSTFLVGLVFLIVEVSRLHPSTNILGKYPLDE